MKIANVMPHPQGDIFNVEERPFGCWPVLRPNEWVYPDVKNGPRCLVEDSTTCAHAQMVRELLPRPRGKK